MPEAVNIVMEQILQVRRNWKGKQWEAEREKPRALSIPIHRDPFIFIKMSVIDNTSLLGDVTYQFLLLCVYWWQEHTYGLSSQEYQHNTVLEHGGPSEVLHQVLQVLKFVLLLVQPSFNMLERKNEIAVSFLCMSCEFK